VTVIFRRNDTLELNVVEYRGSVTLAELKALAEAQARNPGPLKSDTLSWVLPGADFNSIDLAALDELFAFYRSLYSPMHFQIFRRSAWLCQSLAALPHVQHWADGRNTRQDLSSDVRLVNTMAEAGEWLILSEAETAMMESGQDFTEQARFTLPADLPRSQAR
jgi:hypothetical protein